MTPQHWSKPSTDHSTLTQKHLIALSYQLQNHAIILWLILSLYILLIKVGEECQDHILPNKEEVWRQEVLLH